MFRKKQNHISSSISSLQPIVALLQPPTCLTPNSQDNSIIFFDYVIMKICLLCTHVYICTYMYIYKTT